MATQAAWDAELRLLRLDDREDLAVFCEQESSDYLRGVFAEKYRTAVGVFPEQRHEFREALVRMMNCGGMPLADLIEAFNRR